MKLNQREHPPCPPVREGGLGRGSGYALLYLITYTRKAIPYIVVTKADYVNTQRVQELRPYAIIYFCFCLFVLLPIYFSS